MADEVADADCTGYGHHDLFPHCGVPEGDQRGRSLHRAWEEFFVRLPHHNLLHGDENFGQDPLQTIFQSCHVWRFFTIAARPDIDSSDYLAVSVTFFPSA
jgi:hypothetical protein